MQTEQLILWGGLISYIAASFVAIVMVIFNRRLSEWVLGLLLSGLALHLAAIVLRWARLGHGPFITQFEILSSNLWSLLFFYTMVYIKISAIRATAAVVLPLMFIMMGWLLVANPAQGFLPPTYHTIWMYIHIALGKVFLGSVLVAVGMSLIILLRHFDLADFFQLPNDKSLVELSYRFMLVALIFDSLMLISGAIWAQDAWGRYWAWDRLETWAFLTWIGLVFFVHLRLVSELRPIINAYLIFIIFALAFFTFFGVPFVSDSTHKGAI